MNPLIQRLTEDRQLESFHGVTRYAACGHTDRCKCSFPDHSKRVVEGKCPNCQWKEKPGQMCTIGKVVESKEVKPVKVDTKTEVVETWLCPHCQQEIHEKHMFCENEVMHHSDCGGAIKLPPYDWSKISPEWRALLEPHARS